MGIDKSKLGNLNNILKILTSIFKSQNEPVEPLPPPLLMVGANLRPGVSAQEIASRIIARQSESGRQVGDVFADGPNNEEAMELIRVEEIISAILTDAKIEIVIPPGVPVTTIGIGNLGAPVVSNGVTSGIANGIGIIR